MEDFSIELAGIPINVKCKYEENKTFFTGYYTSKKPAFSVEPDEETIIGVQADFDVLNESEGSPKVAYPKSFLENNAIHILIADKLSEYNAIMLHGSALAIDGKGIIFTAKSGTGKSTHTRLWREVFGSRVQMINDDKPLIRVDEMKVYGTPWNGKHHLSNNIAAPLKAIVKLERATENQVKPLGVKESLDMLMKRTHVPTNPSQKALVMNLYLKLVGSLPFYKLECNMDPEAAQVVYNTIINNKFILNKNGGETNEEGICNSRG
ncbi:MAG: hypothetical protein J5372_05980 [Lachnospiraceae bacterium]|nr:hypothetical protein [Lachnospiraceae bacterium]